MSTGVFIARPENEFQTHRAIQMMLLVEPFNAAIFMHNVIRGAWNLCHRLRLLKTLEAALAQQIFSRQPIVIRMRELEYRYFLSLRVEGTLPILLLLVLEVEESDEVREYQVDHAEYEEETQHH